MMGRLSKRLLMGGGAVAAVAAVSLFFSTDGDYPIRIWKDGSVYRLDGKPDPAPYKLDSFLRKIDWTFTNDTGDPNLRVQIDSFSCNNVPVTDCPLRLDPGGTIDCSS